jgi:diguanylate cyclase (GGDEF)-like protein
MSMLAMRRAAGDMTDARRAATEAEAAKQALRWRRFLFAAAFSLLYLLVLGLFYVEGAVEPETLIHASVIVFSFFVLFAVLFRTGLNLRFDDPSLTQWQMLASLFTMLYVVYRAPQTRTAYTAFFFVALMFGLLRRTSRTVAVVGIVSLAAYLVVIWMRYINHQDTSVLRADLLQLAIMSVTLPWFLVIGKHIKRLGQQLAAVSIKLEDISEQARRDELTKVYNRRALLVALDAAKQRADAVGDGLSICIIDLDHFKRFNDELDHLAGDRVLQRFADVVQSGLRGSDVFGRYGGEEFIQILPHTGLAGAVGEGERLRRRLVQIDLGDARKLGPLTCSIGVAQYRPGETMTTLLARADAALYRAKEAGRDRVEY